MKTAYEKLILELIENTLLKLDEAKANKRTFCFGTGKAGVLGYLKVFYEQSGLSEDEIKTKIAKDTEELEEGCYIITEQGITYYGKTK